MRNSSSRMACPLDGRPPRTTSSVSNLTLPYMDKNRSFDRGHPYRWTEGQRDPTPVGTVGLVSDRTRTQRGDRDNIRTAPRRWGDGGSGICHDCRTKYGSCTLPLSCLVLSCPHPIPYFYLLPFTLSCFAVSCFAVLCLVVSYFT